VNRRLVYTNRNKNQTARQVFEEFVRVMFDSPPRKVGEMKNQFFTLQEGRYLYTVQWLDEYWQVWMERERGE